MRSIAVVWTLFVLGWQACPAPAAHAVKLKFDSYGGYFVSNQFEPAAARSFVVISDQGRFDKVFGVARVMGDRSHRLPKDAFKSNLVLAVIQRGNAVWQYQVEDVTVDGGVVQLRYMATAKKSESASFACPLIVSIPKGDYTAVRFVENKRPVKIIQITR